MDYAGVVRPDLGELRLVVVDGRSEVIAKLFEIRDAGTFIPVLAVQLGPTDDDESERWLMARAGFGRQPEDQREYVVFCAINGGEPCRCHIDPYSWGQNPRTYFVAHDYIRAHFDELESGAVVDVEFIFGIRPNPKLSERLEYA